MIPAERGRRRLALELAVSAVLLAAGLASWLDYRSWTVEQERLAALARETGALDHFPDLPAVLRREPHVAHARLDLARALLAVELDRRWQLDLPEAQRRRELERGFDRLAAARDLALATLEVQPADWQAAYVVGGSNFLTLSRRGDPALRSNPALWEDLLARARELAPEHPEPARFLAAAYLGHWSRLSPTERGGATALLASALRNPTTFDLLIEPWLRVAPSLEAALAVVPDDPRAWLQLQGVFAGRGDVERYRDATERLYASLGPFVEERLRESETLLARRAVKEARELLAWSIANLRPSRDHASLFERALALLPPGPASGSWVSDWLGWSLELCPYGGCPLAPRTMARLAGLAGDADLATRAAAAVAAGDLPAGERLERAEAGSLEGGWGLYWLLKGRHLLEAGRAAEASAALGRASGPWGGSAVAWRARLEAAEASGNAAAAQQARVALTTLTAAAWPAAAWQPGRRAQRLTVLPAPHGERLAVGLAADTGGGVAELLWDGQRLGFYTLGGGTLTLRPDLSSVPHALDLVPVLGPPPRPREAWLLPAAVAP